MKEGNGSIDNFLNNNNDNNDDDINVNIVEVDDNGEQSPNNCFIDLDLVELIPRVDDCFRHKRDGLDNGGDEDIFAFNTGNTEHHANAHLCTKHHRQILAWFEL
jgi:hypothetical protein